MFWYFRLFRRATTTPNNNNNGNFIRSADEQPCRRPGPRLEADRRLVQDLHRVLAEGYQLRRPFVIIQHLLQPIHRLLCDVPILEPHRQDMRFSNRNLDMDAAQIQR